MDKWIAIPVVAVLAVGLIFGGYFLWQQTSKLGEAESEIVALEGDITTLEGDVSTLEGDVSTLEGDVSTLEGELADSEAEVSTLEADLGNARNTLQAQQNINLALSAELKTVKDPRHFASVTELVDWLHEDDTDTRYAGEDVPGICYILQVRALRDGYLLPARVDVEGGDLWFSNWVVIGDEVYSVYAWDDSMHFIGFLYSPPPSHPLPLD